jgi:hypothetical protein
VINVFLDDYRHCPEGFVWAKTAAECIELLEHCQVDILSLDYDLGWGEPTGYEVTLYMVKHQRYPRAIYLHTSSPTGRMNMYHLLASHIPKRVELYAYAVPGYVLEQIRRDKK